VCNLCICRKEKCHLIGYQPMDPHLRSQYKATLKDSGGPAQVHHKASSARRTRGLSSNLLPETYDDIAAVGLANNGSHLQSSGQAEENNMESEGLDEDLVEFGSGVLDPSFIENLSEENIALFSRREELRQRDTQLKRKIGDLEHELEETKRKCGQLAAELKVRKNQLNLPSM